jgi:hypothetical protein
MNQAGDPLRSICQTWMTEVAIFLGRASLEQNLTVLRLADEALRVLLR